MHTETVTAPPVLSGLKQAHILRAMLRLGTFTRKELAEAASVEVSVVNGVIVRQRHLLSSVAHRRSGKAGPPEEVLTLRPDAEREIFKQLAPLYSAFDSQSAKSEPGAYEPVALQYQAAVELIDVIEQRKTATEDQVERIVSLLATAAELDGVSSPTSFWVPKIEDTGLNGFQLASKARIDIQKGRLCLVLGTYVPEWRSGVFGNRDLLNLGLVYLTHAAQLFKKLNAPHEISAIDYLCMQYLMKVGALSAKDLRLLAERVNPSGLQLTTLCLGRALWSRPLGTGKDVFCTFVAGTTTMRALPGSEPTTIRIQRQPEGYTVEAASPASADASGSSEEQLVVTMNPTRIVEGMVTAYRVNYSPSDDDVVGLVDLRETGINFAVVKGTEPLVTANVSSEFGHDVVVDQVLEIAKDLEPVAMRRGAKQIGKIYVSGDPSMTVRFADQAKQGLTRRVDILNPLRRGIIAVPGKPSSQLASRAAEIGLAVEAVESAVVNYVATIFPAPQKFGT